MTVWDEGTYVPRSSPTPSSPSSSRAAAPRAATRVVPDRRSQLDDPPDGPAGRPRSAPPARALRADPAPTRAPASGPSQGWAIESHWPGLRCVLLSSDGVVDLLAQGRDPVTPQFPEVRTVGRALGATEVALDGVITAAGAGRPRLERRLAGRVRFHPAAPGPRRARVVRGVRPAVAGRPSHDRGSRGERRRRLEDLALEGPAWTTPSAITGDVPAVLAAAAGAGVEKLVAKRTGRGVRPPDRPGPVAHPHPRRLGDEGLGLLIAHRASELELQRAHVAEGPHDRQPRRR